MDESVRSAWASARPTTDHPVDSACVAPWVSLEFDPAGWVYACCASGLYPLGRIGEQPLRELWGGERALVFRESLQRWDLTVACGPCRWHLEHGRMDPVAAVYDRYPVSSPEPDRPYSMLFALSNRCNLGCVMCTPELSSTLRHEAGLPALPSPYDDEFFEDLAPFLDGLGLAKFVGGEPFLAPEHRRVWQLMDQLASPPSMQVTTNGTIWTDRVEWLLGRFEVDISISIDAATAPTYEAIRRGGNHRELLENVERFQRACDERGTELHVSYCLMDNNTHELGDFLAWAERFRIPASVNLVTDDGLALHDRPLDFLARVRSEWNADAARLERQLEKNRTVWETQRSQLDAVIAEREAGLAPTPRQAQPVPSGFFSVPPTDRIESGSPWTRRRARRRDDSAIAEQSGRLERWSCGGPVAVVLLDPVGLVTNVRSPHPRLGIDARTLVGTPVGDLVRRIEVADGRPAWIIEHAELDDATVRTLVLSHERPLRGTHGSIVRTLQVPLSSGWALLVAEDRIYDRTDSADADPITPDRTTPVQVSRSARADG